jgi:hypothetical protein
MFAVRFTLDLILRQPHLCWKHSSPTSTTSLEQFSATLFYFAPERDFGVAGAFLADVHADEQPRVRFRLFSCMNKLAKVRRNYESYSHR